MGTPVPDEWPGLEDDKWYKTTVDSFYDDEFRDECLGEYIGRFTCCVKGIDINGWYFAEFECTTYVGLCGFPALPEQRCVCITGPYDSEGDCLAG